MVEVILITITVAIVSFLMAFLVQFNLKRERKAQAEALEEGWKDGKHAGLAIAAATVQHILKNGKDLDDIQERLSEITSRWVDYDPVAYEEQKRKIASLREGQKRYEVSIYYRSQLEEPPACEDDLPYHLEQLHDMWVEGRNVEFAFNLVKEFIRCSPDGVESVLKDVFNERFIPYHTLEWNPIVRLDDAQHKSAAFECVSFPFLYKNGLKATLTIKICYGDTEK